MHIELTEMLRCPADHREEFLVLSTGEMSGRMVLSGLLGCPVCRKEYEVVDGVVDFGEKGTAPASAAALKVQAAGSPAGAGRSPPADAATLQALLDLGGPGGIVVLLGEAVTQAEGLASLMSGIHFVGVNPPDGVEELPVLSLVRCGSSVPLRGSVARGVVIGSDVAVAPWLAEGHRVLLRGRRFVIEGEPTDLPPGITRLAAGDGVVVGEKR